MSEQPKHYNLMNWNGKLLQEFDAIYSEAIEYALSYFGTNQDVIHHGYWFGTRSGVYLGCLQEVTK